MILPSCSLGPGSEHDCGSESLGSFSYSCFGASHEISPLKENSKVRSKSDSAGGLAR